MCGRKQHGTVIRFYHENNFFAQTLSHPLFDQRFRVLRLAQPNESGIQAFLDQDIFSANSDSGIRLLYPSIVCYRVSDNHTTRTLVFRVST